MFKKPIDFQVESYINSRIGLDGDIQEKSEVLRHLVSFLTLKDVQNLNEELIKKYNNHIRGLCSNFQYKKRCLIVRSFLRHSGISNKGILYPVI